MRLNAINIIRPNFMCFELAFAWISAIYKYNLGGDRFSDYTFQKGWFIAYSCKNMALNEKLCPTEVSIVMLMNYSNYKSYCK